MVNKLEQRLELFLDAASSSGSPRRSLATYRVLVVTGLTGLRIGEAAALRISRLDLLAGGVELLRRTEVNGRLVSCV